MLAHPYGYPKIMSSFYFSNFDQGPPQMPVHGASGRVACGGTSHQFQAPNGRPWVCEHRWTSLANMVGWRRSAGTNGVGAFWAPDGNRMFMCRGQAACVVFNRGGIWWKPRLRLPMPPGSYCNIIKSDNVSSCAAITVDGHGFAVVEVPPISAVALHVGKRILEHQSSSSSGTTTAPAKPPATSSSTLSAAPSTTVPRLRGTPGPSIEVVEPTAELPTAYAASIRACVASNERVGGACQWGMLGSSQLCYIRSTIECCQAAGFGVAACCKLAEASTVPYEYRKKAGVERCFTAAPGAKKCAKKLENCASTGCCEDAGHTCYEKDLWWSGCLSTCTPGMKDPFGKHGHWSCRKAGLSASRRGALLHQ